MARKAKLPERLVGWHKVQRTVTSYGRPYTDDVTLDIRYGGLEFSELRREMDSLEAEFGAEFERFKIETDVEYQYGDETIVTRVYGWRTESDAEYQARLDADAARVSAREQQERKEFERLAKKFGKNA